MKYAFPYSNTPVQRSDDSSGMTLRDYFAGQALVGLLSGMLADGAKLRADSPKNVAITAYLTADAMLKVRGEA